MSLSESQELGPSEMGYPPVYTTVRPLYEGPNFPIVQPVAVETVACLSFYEILRVVLSYSISTPSVW
jgi:hypothetical protein